MAEVTVLYDEGCGLCTSLAGWLEEHGIETAPIGSPAGALLLRDLGPSGRYAAVHAVDELGRRASGGAALPLILAALPHGRLPAALYRRFPAPVEATYRLVATRRVQISRWLRS